MTNNPGVIRIDGGKVSNEYLYQVRVDGQLLFCKVNGYGLNDVDIGDAINGACGRVALIDVARMDELWRGWVDVTDNDSQPKKYSTWKLDKLLDAHRVKFPMLSGLANKVGSKMLEQLINVLGRCSVAGMGLLTALEAARYSMTSKPGDVNVVFYTPDCVSLAASNVTERKFLSPESIARLTHDVIKNIKEQLNLRQELVSKGSNSGSQSSPKATVYSRSGSYVAVWTRGRSLSPEFVEGKENADVKLANEIIQSSSGNAWIKDDAVQFNDKDRIGLNLDNNGVENNGAESSLGDEASEVLLEDNNQCLIAVIKDIEGELRGFSELGVGERGKFRKVLGDEDKQFPVVFYRTTLDFVKKAGIRFD